ncbi:MAG: hypothetical protein R3C58_11725 [Parvularculaceae bacterium]
MDEQAVAAVLAQDIGDHFTAIQIGAFVVMLVLAVTGAALAMRAYAIMSEAQAIYWRAMSMLSAASPTDEARKARAQAIRSSQPLRRVKSGRARHVM